MCPSTKACPFCRFAVPASLLNVLVCVQGYLLRTFIVARLDYEMKKMCQTTPYIKENGLKTCYMFEEMLIVQSLVRKLAIMVNDLNQVIEFEDNHR